MSYLEMKNVTFRHGHDTMRVYVHVLVSLERCLMKMMRAAARSLPGYSVEDAADFLEYDRSAIEYWLRMGHLDGEWDSRVGRWRIRPQALIDFLRQSREPMPTGRCLSTRTPSAPAVAVESLAD